MQLADIESLLKNYPLVKWDLFELLRSVENAAKAYPRLGTSVTPRHDPIRLCQNPYLEFSSTTVESYEPATAERPLRLYLRCFGIFGPNGALPLIWTEFIRNRLRHYRDGTLRGFLNIFQHRFYCLFYRAWATANKAVDFDRPAESRFRFYLSSLIGDIPTKESEENFVGSGYAPIDSLQLAKLYFAGRLIAKYAQPECLEAIISEYFHIPVKIQNWAGHWLGLPEGERCKLGRQNPTAQLGVGALLGERVWDVASRFRVVLGPMNHKRFRDFLPSQRSRRRLELILQYLTGDSWEIEIQLLLEGPLTPPFKLGETGFLGWDTWLETTHPQKPRTECIFTN